MFRVPFRPSMSELWLSLPPPPAMLLLLFMVYHSYSMLFFCYFLLSVPLPLATLNLLGGGFYHLFCSTACSTLWSVGSVGPLRSVRSVAAGRFGRYSRRFGRYSGFMRLTPAQLTSSDPPSVRKIGWVQRRTRDPPLVHHVLQLMQALLWPQTC
jgi:hypothetical protein